MCAAPSGVSRCRRGRKVGGRWTLQRPVCTCVCRACARVYVCALVLVHVLRAAGPPRVEWSPLTVYTCVTAPKTFHGPSWSQLSLTSQMWLMRRLVFVLLKRKAVVRSPWLASERGLRQGGNSQHCPNVTADTHAHLSLVSPRCPHSPLSLHEGQNLSTLVATLPSLFTFVPGACTSRGCAKAAARPHHTPHTCRHLWLRCHATGDPPLTPAACRT